jgi:hypothetical protein
MDKTMEDQIERAKHSEQIKDVNAIRRVLRLSLPDQVRDVLEQRAYGLQLDYDQWADRVRAEARERMAKRVR